MMFCPTRILVPVDFTSSAAPAVACAFDLARVFGSPVHLLHVAAAPGADGWSAFVPADETAHRDETWRTDAMDTLVAFAAESGFRGVGRLGPSLAVRSSGDPAAAIVAYAREIACDMIVMGTHPPSTLSALLGSTADWVRRHASCPVLLVPAAPAAAPRQAWLPAGLTARSAFARPVS